MTSQTNEKALEATIEKVLTGSCLEEQSKGLLKAHSINSTEGNGFLSGDPHDFNKKYAIDEKLFWQFLETTQKNELAKLKKSSDWKLKVLERLDKMVTKYGILRILRKGLEVEDAHLIFLYQLPLASSSQTSKENFEKNIFNVTRQVHYSLDNPRESLDLVLFINGLPISTLELKNPWTGQNARVHAIKQYKNDRDTKQPLLNFARCIVHFALDTDEVFMTTKLEGKDTLFLPFNKGYNNGKDNPPNPYGYKTAYLWEEIFTRQSLVNIIQHFVRLGGKPSEPLSKKTLFFPRYHQLDVVRKIIEDTSKKGVGQKYLIQHSAGSGKSNSITWISYQLIEVYPENEGVSGFRGKDIPLFDSVIVVTDRKLLDQQIRDNIKEFSEVKNIVAPAYSSRELKESLEQGKKIIITTIQKFPVIVDGISDLSEKKFAVVIDEAHSSQEGLSSRKMNQAMGIEEDEDTQDKILKALKTSKMKGNATYLAFTATPKNSTLNKFGNEQEDGSYKPFHLYSMKQAIQEGFILDVLANYTTYKSYYEIEKSIEENPLFETKKAQKKLRAKVERDKSTIATKAEIMMDHFITKIFNTKKLNGKAKGMVVTQNIESAIRYYHAIKRILQDKKNPFQVVIAFSGKKTVDGIENTEEILNGFPEKDTRDYFKKDEYRILVVANKYLTGFDEPKLCCMYVDKKLQGVLAVQSLSRLNRAADNLGKKTEDLFILDFFNTTEDIKEAFDPFYTSTTLSKATDVNVLHELKNLLDDVGVYEWIEVEQFVTMYFKNEGADKLSSVMDIAVARFNHELELEEKDKADFKIKAKQFVKIYGQMSSIMPYEMLSWEKLFWFLKFLIPKLVIVNKEDDLIDELLNSVDLSTYGLERTKLNFSIGLDESETVLDPQNPNPRSAHSEDEKETLDEIIRTFNERWFQGWDATPEEQKERLVKLKESICSHKDYQTKVAENQDSQNKILALKKILDDVMTKRRKQEIELYKMYVKDETFQQTFFDTIMRILFVT
ncbi:MAG: type I restriction endonuclease subunit R [Leptospiraceae bacterium]|nr:type I restriction endonuclease subunit R [Leptospiraceae bacterium]